MLVFSKHCNNGATGKAKQRNLTMTDNKSRAKTQSKDNAAAKTSATAKNSSTPEEDKTQANAGEPATDKAAASDTGSDSSAPSVNTKKSRRPRRSSHLGGFSSLIIFVLFITVIAALVYWIEKQQKELASLNRYQIEQLRSELSPELEQLKAGNSELQQQLAIQEKNQQALNEAFSNLLKTRRHLRNDWLLAEADYLLRLASHRLLLARDTGSALAAMQTADERLRDLADPAVIPVRNTLAEDISRLKAVHEPDIAGLSARLSALAHAVDSLPLLSAYTARMPTNVEADSAENARVEDWKQLPEAIWSDIKKLLVIRERHGKVIPLLSPEQHFFLIQNLKLKLEQARLALLNAEQDIYQERLQTAADWIRDFFKQDDPTTQAMLAQLEQLAAENIKPALPDISASYRALQDFREQQTDSAGSSGDHS